MDKLIARITTNHSLVPLSMYLFNIDGLQLYFNARAPQELNNGDIESKVFNRKSYVKVGSWVKHQNDFMFILNALGTFKATYMNDSRYTVSKHQWDDSLGMAQETVDIKKLIYPDCDFSIYLEVKRTLGDSQ